MFFSVVANTPVSPGNGEPGNIPEYDEAEVRVRLKHLSQEVIDVKYVPAVGSYIRTYTLRHRDRAERILGKTVMYFPLFEAFLKKYDLPEELKYLPIVESALDPLAVSRAGAVGLWQFMPATALELGLKIDESVDERQDPVKSTEAAMVHLGRQYKRFGDWTLALAAYNSGSGRVSRAIKRARTKNFWRLQRYLPRETRNYVPAFIAATYLVDYYDQHELAPEYPSLDLQLTETMKVYGYHSFYRIAQLTDLPLDVIQVLNPAYLKGFIPNDPDGNYLTLPRRVMGAFRDYVSTLRPDSSEEPPIFSGPIAFSRPAAAANANYVRSTYVASEGETLRSIAQVLHCSVHQLKVWNKLKTEQLEPGQELTVFLPREFKKFKPLKTLKAMEALPGLPLQTIPVEKERAIEPSNAIRGTYLHLEVKRRERLSSIADRLPGISTEDLLKLNELAKDKTLKPGTRIRIYRF